MANGINYEERKKVKRPIFNVRDLELGYCTKKVLMQELTKPMHGRMYYTTDTHEFFFDFDGTRIPLNMTGDNADIEQALQQINDKIAQLDPSNIDKLSEQVNKAVSDVKTAQEEIKQAKSDVANAVKKAEDAASAVSSKVDASYVDNKVKDLASQSSVTELQNKLNQIKTVSSVETTEDGYTLTLSDGTQLVLKNGKDGVNGVDGVDGDSVTVTTSKVEKTTTVTFTDKNGEHSFEVKDGVDGVNGIDGINGVDGKDGESVVFTSSEKVDGVTTVVITDKDGDHTFQVNDGITPTIEIEQTSKHWVINGVDSGIVAEGKDGVDGVNGVDGKDGITPTIEIDETTKHWIINGVDSGIVAEGKDGKDASSSEYFELNVTDKNMILEGNNLSLKYGDDSTITEITQDTVVADEKDGLVTLSQVLELLKKKGDDVVVVDYIYINHGTPGQPNLTDVVNYKSYKITDEYFSEETTPIYASPREWRGDVEKYIEESSMATTFGFDIPQNYSFKALRQDPTNPNKWDDLTLGFISNPRYSTKQYGEQVYNCYSRMTNTADGTWYTDAVDYDSTFNYKIILTKNN